MWLNMLSQGKLCSRTHLGIKFFLNVGFHNGLDGLINYQCKKISRTILEYTCTLEKKKKLYVKVKKQKTCPKHTRNFPKSHILNLLGASRLGKED